MLFISNFLIDILHLGCSITVMVRIQQHFRYVHLKYVHFQVSQKSQ